MTKPIITIGVCVRNADATIKKAIESILHQDFPHELMEVIFVDDGSEDKTLQIIQNYVSKMNISAKVFHTSWQGIGAARNLVVRNAAGKYIIWVDGDMSLPRDHVRKQVEFMEKNPKIGIAKARYGILPNDSLVGFLENIAFVAVDIMYGGRVTSRGLGTGGSIYRVEAIRKAGGFDPNLRGVGEDLDAESRVRKAGWLLCLGSPAAFYERRRQSWPSLWQEAVWHGHGGYHVFRKNRETFALYKMTPLAGFIAGVWYSTVAYKATRRKVVFLMPIHYAFKRIGWLFGFIKGQLGR